MSSCRYNTEILSVYSNVTCILILSYRDVDKYRVLELYVYYLKGIKYIVIYGIPQKKQNISCFYFLL